MPEISCPGKQERLLIMKMSVFGFATTRRFAAIAILASFVFSNVFAVDAIRGDKSNSQKSVLTVKDTTDLTQLGREGRLRENPSYEKETMSLVKALEEGGLCQPVIINQDKAVQEIVVEQLAIMIARGKAAESSCRKVDHQDQTDVLFSNARSAADIQRSSIRSLMRQLLQRDRPFSSSMN